MFWPVILFQNCFRCFKIVLDVLGPLVFNIILKTVYQVLFRNSQWDFDWGYNESICQPEKNWHLDNINYSNPWAWYSSPFIYVFFSVLPGLFYSFYYIGIACILRYLSINISWFRCYCKVYFLISQLFTRINMQLIFAFWPFATYWTQLLDLSFLIKYF